MRGKLSTKFCLSATIRKATIFFFFFFSIILSSRAAYVNSTKDGNWGTASTWSSQSIPGSADNVTINNLVTISLGSTYTATTLDIGNKGKLVVNGTLIITGNFTMDSQGDFEMGPNSVVIVKGNVILGTQTIFSLSSYFIVYGNLSSQSNGGNGSINVNTSHIYILGTVTVPYTYFSVCDTYDGTTSNTTESCDGGTFEALITNETSNTNPVISEVVQQSIEQVTIDVNNLTSSSPCFCNEGSVTLTIGDTSTPTNVSIIKWYSGTSLKTTQTNPTKPYSYPANQAGTYNALYKIGTIWYQTNSVTLTNKQTPTASISGSTTICAGSSATITISLTEESPWNFTYTDGSTSTTVTSQTTSPYTLSVSPSSTKTYTLTSISNGCCTGTTNGAATITVNSSNVSITGQPAAGQTKCLGNNFDPISVVASATTGSITGYQWYRNTTASNSGGTLIPGASTASYTPLATSSGTLYYYCVVSGTCGTATSAVSGAFIVNPLNSSSTPSSTPTLCINSSLTPITHTTTGATGIGAATGLPAGVSAAWAGGTITISGTPTVSGTFNYSIPLTGGCGNITATGSINVIPNNTINLTSAVGTNAQTTCINTAIANITYSTTGATGIGTPTGLPNGVSAAWAGGTITISGTPTASGTFNYSIPLTGGCGSVSTTGTITVTPASVAGTVTPALAEVCLNTGTTLTLSGYIGSIQWQTNSSGSWQNITGATFETYNTPNLTKATSFRAVITNGTCSSAISNEVAITLDQVLPTFSNCPANRSVNVDQGLCSAIVEWDIPSATDNCGTPTVAVIANEPITTIGGKHRATIAVGTSTIKYTATDNNGNLQTCTFTITVTDNISPQITCPPGQSVFCAENAPIYTNLAEFTAAGGTATDNCSLNAGSFTRLTDVSNGNALTRTYRISDAAGNSSSCEQVFTISQPSVSIQSQNTTTCIGGTFSITSTISSGFGAVNYQWQKRANSTSPWNNIAGATSSQLDGTLGSFQEEYRLLVSQTTGFSGACSPASDPLTFSDTQAPVFSGYAPQNQILCTAPGATTAAASGMSIQEIDVIDNCTLNLSTGLSYTITGVGATGVSATGNNLPENPQFNVGTSTVTYTVSDTYGNVGTHKVTIVVQAAPAPITIAYSSGGNQPTQCSGYTYSVDGGVTQPGYTYEWKVLSGATPVTSGFSVTNAGTASGSITWTGDLPAGNYTLEATKRAANGCESNANLAIALQNNFDLKVEPAGQDCKGEFPQGTTRIITWEVTRLCGTSAWGFTYYLFDGPLTSLPANHQSINIGTGTISVENKNSITFNTTVEYGNQPYTQTVFTLFIVNGSDSNSGNDYNYFYLKGIPETSPISTD